MAPRKLSDSDKNDIVDLYRQPGQTSSTLAEQFGVSNSTISRILKTALPSDEYSELIAQKRMSSGTATKPAPTRKRRSSKQTTSKQTAPRQKDTDDGQLPLLDPVDPDSEADSDASEQNADQNVDQSVEVDSSAPKPAPKPTPKPVPAPILAKSKDDEDDEDEDDDLEGLDDTLGDDFGDDDEDDLDDEDLDDEDDEDEFEVPKPKLQTEESIEIMPLGSAVMPKPCYLVVDMRAELITRPLSEFGHLGRIPSDEEKSNTLPVFDNHRVARRFSRNKQRVIKVPDGSLITRTSPYLQAKGITRLLVDGQVFDLAGL